VLAEICALTVLANTVNFSVFARDSVIFSSHNTARVISSTVLFDQNNLGQVASM